MNIRIIESQNKDQEAEQVQIYFCTAFLGYRSRRKPKTTKDTLQKTVCAQLKSNILPEMALLLQTMVTFEQIIKNHL